MNLNETSLINGQAFDWASISFNVFGVDFKGVTEISYKRKREKVNNYAAGHEPSNRGNGRTEYEFGWSIEEIEVRRLLTALNDPNLSLIDIPAFTVTVSWMVGTKTYTDKINNVEFVDEGVEMKEGDTNALRKCEMICAGIKYGRGQ